MNLAIRGIDSSQVKWNNEGSFLNNAHKDLKADFIIANPPFNVSDWSGELLRGDGRWQYGTPPAGNANFAWLQHFIYHLAPNGQAGVVLSKGALTSKSSGEGEIRRALIEDGNVIDCIVNLSAKLFLNTQIPAALWFMRRGRNTKKDAMKDRSRDAINRVSDTTKSTINHTEKGAMNPGAIKDAMNPDAMNRVSTVDRSGEILFIDARNLGHLINRRTRELSADDIKQIADTYHNWRNSDGDYEDIKGFCCSASIERVKELDYVLTAGRYVGLPDEEDDFNFNERFSALKAEFEAQLNEEAELNKAIMENLARIAL
jgi:type I restriction enzyme M protein